MKRTSPEVYYNLNVMVFADGDEFAYSVIQEFDEEGRERDVLVSGAADTLKIAVAVAKSVVEVALS